VLYFEIDITFSSCRYDIDGTHARARKCVDILSKSRTAAIELASSASVVDKRFRKRLRRGDDERRKDTS